MSQHLIIDFVNRITTFKPIKGAKIASRKIKKYQGSTRDNNELPQEGAQDTSVMNKVHSAGLDQEENREPRESAKKIDITI